MRQRGVRGRGGEARGGARGREPVSTRCLRAGRGGAQGARRLASALAIVGGAVGCGTQGGPGGGDLHLPNAAAGPFRPLRPGEVGEARVAPLVLVDERRHLRAMVVLDEDRDPATPAAWGYAAGRAPPAAGEPSPADLPPDRLFRARAADGRSFDRHPLELLAAAEPWEEGTLDAPAALRVEDEVWLYYAGAEGIGLARSGDGVSFERRGQVLGAPVGGWDAGLVPGSPAVLRLDDGGFVLFYEAGGAIGEARSPDGVAWERVPDGPVLSPAAPTSAGAALDEAAVGAPFALLATSPLGRRILRLYHESRDLGGGRTIGLAARFEPGGAFQRAVAPVWPGDLEPREPCVVAAPDHALLFVTQRGGDAVDDPPVAVAAGVAPADLTLPAPPP